MSEDSRFLLLTYQYDEERFAGPPHSISMDLVKQLFRKYCNLIATHRYSSTLSRTLIELVSRMQVFTSKILQIVELRCL